MRITIGSVQYLVSLPLRVAAATFAIAERIFHYVVDRGAVRITGYQKRGSDAFYLGLPADVTVENVDLLSQTSPISEAETVAAAPIAEQPSRPLLAVGSLALLSLVGAIAWRSRREGEPSNT